MSITQYEPHTTTTTKKKKKKKKKLPFGIFKQEEMEHWNGVNRLGTSLVQQSKAHNIILPFSILPKIHEKSIKCRNSLLDKVGVTSSEFKLSDCCMRVIISGTLTAKAASRKK